MAIGLPTKPKFIVKYTIVVQINGPNTNGININGFKIIGVPKINGSLIPNKLGIMDTLPTEFNDFAFDLIIKIFNPNVKPDPDTHNIQ